MRLTFLTATAVVALATASVGEAQAAGAGMPGLYVQAYGGAALPGTWTWGNPIPYSTVPIDLGSAFGASLGMATGLDGVSIEADIFHTNRMGGGYPVTTTSLMLDGKYSFHLSDTFDVYAGAGVGAIDLGYDFGGTENYNGWGLGYQVMIGVGAKVADNIDIFAEVRHQDTFGQITVPSVNAGDTYTGRAPVNAILIGLRIPLGAPPPPP